MASQMNVDKPAPNVQRSQSARFASRSIEQIGPISKGPREHTSPLHYADDGHGDSRDKLSSPEKSYAVQQETPVKSTLIKDKDKDASKVGGTRANGRESEKPAVLVGFAGSDGVMGADDDLVALTAVANGPASVRDLQRADELHPSPLLGHVTVYHSGRSDDKKKYRPPAAQRQISAVGPPELLDKRKELDGEALGRHVEVYHSGRSDDPKKYFPQNTTTTTSTESRQVEQHETHTTTTTSTVITREQKSPELDVYEQNTPERKTPDKEMDMVPLKNMVAVYHSGQSVDPPKNEVESESDEETKKKSKKMTARLVLTPEREKKEKEKEKEERKEGTPADEDGDESHRSKKEKSPGRGLFGFLSRSKSKEKDDEAATTGRASVVSVPISPPHEGPTDNLDKSKDLDTLPLRHVVEVYHSGYSMLPVKRDRFGNIKPFRYARWPSDESEETIEKIYVKQESYAYVMAAPPAGNEEIPVSSMSRQQEMETVPLKQTVRVYHSGQSLVKQKGLKAKLRKKVSSLKATPLSDGTTETSEESSSGEDSDDEGESTLKKLGAILHLKPSTNRASREVSEEKDQLTKEEKRRSGSGFFGFFGGKDKKKEASEEKEVAVKTSEVTTATTSPTTATYPTSEKYEGPQENLQKNEVLDDIPLRRQVHVYHSGYSAVPGKRKKNSPFRRFLVGGDEETVERAHVNLDAYYIKPEKYEGPVDALGPKQDLEPVPLKQSVRVYHSGQSVVKEKKKKKTEKSKKVKKLKETSPLKRRGSESTESMTSTSSDGSETESETEDADGKKKEKKSKKSGGFFGFFHGRHRSKEEARDANEDVVAVTTVTTTNVAAAEPYTGPVADLDKSNELDNAPLRDQVNVYHSGLSVDPDAKKKKKMTAKVTVFSRARFESSSSSSSGDSDSESDETALEGEKKKKSSWFGFGNKKGSYDVTTPPKPKKEKRVKKEKEIVLVNYDYLSKEPHAGEVGDLAKHREELETVPIADHAAVYHSGQSFEKKKKEKGEKSKEKTEKKKKKFKKTLVITPGKKRADSESSSASTTDSSSGESSSESDSEEGGKKSKMTALAFIRPSHAKEKPEVPEKPAKLTAEAKQRSAETPPKKGKGGFLHGLLGSGRKEKSPSPEKEVVTSTTVTTLAPLPSDRHIVIGERYDGPGTSLQKNNELDNLALRQEVAVYHSGLSVDPHLKRSKRTGKEKSFRRERYLSSGGEMTDDEANVSKDKSKVKSWFGSFGRSKSKEAAAAASGKVESPTKHAPIHYDYLSTAPAEGPAGELSTMTELERIPIRQLVRVYHSGQSTEKVKKEKKRPKEKALKKLRARSLSTSSRSSTASSISTTSTSSSSSSSEGEHLLSPDKKKGGGLFGFLKKDRKRKEKSGKADEEATAVVVVAASANDGASQPPPSADAKDKKKKKTKKSKGGKDKDHKDKEGVGATSSASSSSDDSDNEASGKKSKKKQHKLKKVAAPFVANGADSHEKTEEHHLTHAPQQLEHDAEPKQDYEPAADSDGKLVKTVRTTEVYRISGTGEPPVLDPNDTSLQRTLDLSKASNGASPTVELVKRNTTVAYAADKAVPEEKEFLLTEGSGPHTTVRSWQETAEGPETVTTETDEHGNIITRTVKSHQVKQTIQRQTYQTYQVPLDEEGGDGQQTTTVTRQLYSPAHGQPVSAPVGENGVPLVESHSRTIAYEAAGGSDSTHIPDNVPGEFVSSRTVTSGNRTVETITYKTEKDGVVETHVEHRVTIHSGGEIDHDAELSAAIMEATNMNPDMTVEKIEVKQESQC
uniref:Band 4.1 C-terminal domain-containing protein n=1 Tax=Plectus sambesii TaxID=2011161 RepID=A0A914WG63_9BILA